MTLDPNFDYHMHTRYSDGSGSISDMADSAIRKGLKTIAITDHMPLPFDNHYAMDSDVISQYRKDIKNAQERYSGKLEILSGLEFEYLPENKSWTESLVQMGWDHRILSTHTLYVDETPYLVNCNSKRFDTLLNHAFKSDIKTVCRAYFCSMREAVRTGWFNSVGHMDVVKKHNKNQTLFRESESWYQEMVAETLDVIRDEGISMEINTGGFKHPVGESYPGDWLIEEALKRDIPLILSSDSHNPETIGKHFDRINRMVDGL